MNAYASPFGAWDRVSCVRSRPRRVLGGVSADACYFRPDGVAGAGHPLVDELGGDRRRRLELVRLYRYLDEIAYIETEVINVALSHVTYGPTARLFPDAAKSDALRIVADEGHHAYMSFDLKLQLYDATGVRGRDIATPAFYTRYRAIVDALPEADRPMATLLAAIANETLITLNLTQAKDERLQPVVREVIADHADDEAVHHVYFSSLLEQLWKQFDDDQRARYGPLLPAFVRCFALNDAPAELADLLDAGFSEHDARTALAGGDERASASLRAAVVPSMRLLRRLRILDEPHARAAAVAYGLLEEAVAS